MWLYVPGGTSASFPASEPSTSVSPSLCETLSASCTSRGSLRPAKSWSAAFGKGRFATLRSGLTAPPSTTARCAVAWMESLPVGLALPCPWLEGSGGRRMNAGSGARSREPFARLAPDGSWVKTCPGSYLPGMEPPAERYSQAFPRWGSHSSGSLYLCPPSALLKEESGSSCSPSIDNWPTPDTQNDRDGTIARTPAPGRQAGTKHGQSLHHAVEMWATPTSHERTLTPREVDHGIQLANQADLWATPTAKCSEDSQTHRSKERSDELLLTGQAQAMMWATPNVPNGGRVNSAEEVENKGSTEAGKRQVSLEAQTKFWSTPRASDGEKGGPNDWFGPGGTPLTTQAVTLWATPRTAEAMCRESLRPTESIQREIESHSRGGSSTGKLEDMVAIFHSGPPAPETREPGEPSSNTTPGSRPPSPKRRLNPLFVGWLQGMPLGWADPESTSCGPMGISPYLSRWRRHLLCCIGGSLIGEEVGRTCVSAQIKRASL